MGRRLRRSGRGAVRRLGAVALWLAYPARLLIYTLVTRPILLGQTARLVEPLSYGLPPDELQASDIVVRGELHIPQFAVRHLDVAKDLLGPTAKVGVDATRFGFLWDDDALAARYAASVVSSQVPEEPAVEAKRHLLAIEERLREFFGVSGLRHSLYYESDAVLDAVTDYLLRGMRPGSPDPER
jgi:hypothetical protein